MMLNACYGVSYCVLHYFSFGNAVLAKYEGVILTMLILKTIPSQGCFSQQRCPAGLRLVGQSPYNAVIVAAEVVPIRKESDLPADSAKTVSKAKRLCHVSAYL